MWVEGPRRYNTDNTGAGRERERGTRRLDRKKKLKRSESLAPTAFFAAFLTLTVRESFTITGPLGFSKQVID